MIFLFCLSFWFRTVWLVRLIITNESLYYSYCLLCLLLVVVVVDLDAGTGSSEAKFAYCREKLNIFSFSIFVVNLVINKLRLVFTGSVTHT